MTDAIKEVADRVTLHNETILDLLDQVENQRQFILAQAEKLTSLIDLVTALADAVRPAGAQ